MKFFNKIKWVLDRPVVWFVFVLWAGELIIEESSNDFSSALIFIFAIIVWEYERKKRGK